MAQFRQFFLIQSKRDGSFLREDLTFTHLAVRAGRIYDAHEAVDTAINVLDDDYSIFQSYEILDDVSIH